MLSCTLFEISQVSINKNEHNAYRLFQYVLEVVGASTQHVPAGKVTNIINNKV